MLIEVKCNICKAHYKIEWLDLPYDTDVEYCPNCGETDALEVIEKEE